MTESMKHKILRYQANVTVEDIERWLDGWSQGGWEVVSISQTIHGMAVLIRIEKQYYGKGRPDGKKQESQGQEDNTC